MRMIRLLPVAQSRTIAQPAQPAELVKAAEAGDASGVRQLLEAGANPNLPRTFTALEAAAGAFPAVVREMLKFHANVNARDSAGRTPLHLVGKSAVGDSRENPAEVARLLIASGADVNARDNIHGNTLLHETPDAATAKVLIAAGAQLNLRNKDGQTPLMLTLDPEVTRLLVQAGAGLTILDNNGKTALDLAKELELTEKIAVLRSGKK